MEHLKSANPHVRILVLRFLAKVRESELFDAFMSGITTCLCTDSAFVRPYAMSVFVAVAAHFPELLPSGDVIVRDLLMEKDVDHAANVLRNGLLFLLSARPEFAAQVVQHIPFDGLSKDKKLIIVQCIRRLSHHFPQYRLPWLAMIHSAAAEHNASDVLRFEVANAILSLSTLTPAVREASRWFAALVHAKSLTVNLVALERLVDIFMRYGEGADALSIVSACRASNPVITRKVLHVACMFVQAGNVRAVADVLEHEFIATTASLATMNASAGNTSASRGGVSTPLTPSGASAGTEGGSATRSGVGRNIDHVRSYRRFIILKLRKLAARYPDVEKTVFRVLAAALGGKDDTAAVEACIVLRQVLESDAHREEYLSATIDVIAKNEVKSPEALRLAIAACSEWASTCPAMAEKALRRLLEWIGMVPFASKAEADTNAASTPEDTDGVGSKGGNGSKRARSRGFGDGDDDNDYDNDDGGGSADGAGLRTAAYGPSSSRGATGANGTSGGGAGDYVAGGHGDLLDSDERDAMETCAFRYYFVIRRNFFIGTAVGIALCRLFLAFEKEVDGADVQNNAVAASLRELRAKVGFVVAGIIRFMGTADTNMEATGNASSGTRDAPTDGSSAYQTSAASPVQVHYLGRALHALLREVVLTKVRDGTLMLSSNQQNSADGDGAPSTGVSETEFDDLVDALVGGVRGAVKSRNEAAAEAAAAAAIAAGKSRSGSSSALTIAAAAKAAAAAAAEDKEEGFTVKRSEEAAVSDPLSFSLLRNFIGDVTSADDDGSVDLFTAGLSDQNSGDMDEKDLSALGIEMQPGNSSILLSRSDGCTESEHAVDGSESRVSFHELTGSGNTVSVEARVEYQEFGIVVDFTLKNQSYGKHLKNVCVDVNKYGDLKLISTPQAYNLLPGESVTCRSVLRMHSTATGMIFGEVLFETPGDRTGRYSYVTLPLGCIPVNIVHFLSPSVLEMPVYLRLWADLQWENHSTVNVEVSESQSNSVLQYVLRIIARSIKLGLVGGRGGQQKTMANALAAAAGGSGAEATARGVTKSDGAERAAIISANELYVDPDATFVCSNFCTRSVFGEYALVNVSIHRDARNDRRVLGFIRIRAPSKGVALVLGNAWVAVETKLQ